MMHTFDNDFLKIAEEILSENKSPDEWAMIQSSDMFQQGKYSGGFEATEMEFTFSVFEDEKEYWFQLALSDIQKVVDGDIRQVHVREADL